jgi:hypothetical protein
MSIQPINTNLMSVPQILQNLTTNPGQSAVSDKSDGMPDFSFSSGNNGVTGLALTSQSYSSDKLVMQYQNKDGDSLTLSMESIEYQKAMVTANGSASKEDWKKIVDFMKQQYTSMKDEIVKSFLKSNGMDVKDNTNADGASQAASSNDIPGLPAYWNAENTSQRIVDFATSFLGMFKGSGQDFVAMIKDAIDKGFSQAKDDIGDVPDAVSKLTSTTHDLVMKKLDAWAQEQGITNTADQQAGGQATKQAA